MTRPRDLGAMPVVMTDAMAASVQLTARGGLVSEFLTGDPVPFPGVIKAPALARFGDGQVLASPVVS